MKALVLWYRNNRNTINIFQFTFLSVFLLILTWIVDYRYPMLKVNIPSILLLSTEVSTTFLSNLSGVFLTVTTFTFTTILTVINKYSSSFTPRVVQDFIDKPNVLSLFGIFVGGFFYTVLSLFMLQNIVESEKVLSGTIGIFYAIAAMLTFILFVIRVLRDIKVSQVVDDIFQQAEILVDYEADLRRKSERYDEDNLVDTIKIYAPKTGYLYQLDLDLLKKVLENHSCELVTSKRIGEYVPKGMYLANLRFMEKFELDEEEKNKFLGNIAKAFIINQAKNDTRDYHHELTNLVEIALRALSPGINDPNTAILCISKLSQLLGKLFSSENHFIVSMVNEKAKIIYSSYSVEEELYLTFSQLINYGKTDPKVAYAILEGIYLTYMISDESAKGEVKDFFENAYLIMLESMQTEMDSKRLKSIYDDFSKNRDYQSDQKAIKS